ncbi:MAG: purine-nucleoside phosphorylase [Clostridia bacterium]|nr:purine-nucleoside phosphorylase [Clostridia bacterium]
MSKPYPTPHIDASPEDFAKTVLMPGDPLRAKKIAEEFLENAKLVNNVRGIQGYTGEYKGSRVSVMASGMGMPSMGIYCYELFNFFDVENIMRIGSAGAMTEKIQLMDIVIGMGACTNSGFAAQYRLPGTFAPICSYNMLKECIAVADEKGASYHVGNIYSTDNFYTDDEGLEEFETSARLWSKMGVMAVEMESAALYMTAARCGKNALSVCTVSDHLITGESLSADERQNSFTQMMEIALETAKRLD